MSAWAGVSARAKEGYRHLEIVGAVVTIWNCLNWNVVSALAVLSPLAGFPHHQSLSSAPSLPTNVSVAVPKQGCKPGAHVEHTFSLHPLCDSGDYFRGYILMRLHNGGLWRAGGHSLVVQYGWRVALLGMIPFMLDIGAAVSLLIVARVCGRECIVKVTSAAAYRTAVGVVVHVVGC